MTVGICGLGLIGGSMAKAYKESGHRVLGYDLNEATLGYCSLAGITDGTLNESSIPECDLIFIALYPIAAIRYLEEIAPLISKDATVIDLCGTKAKICEIIVESTFIYHPIKKLLNLDYISDKIYSQHKILTEKFSKTTR